LVAAKLQFALRPCDFSSRIVRRAHTGDRPNLSEEVLAAFLPARRVWGRYNIVPMTLHRWLRDDRLDFPRPILIGRMRYWRIADLETWEAARAMAARDGGEQ
jgi:hypothetical protein